MTALHPRVFEPDSRSQGTYDRLYALYRRVHDAFGVVGTQDDLSRRDERRCWRSETRCGMADDNTSN